MQHCAICNHGKSNHILMKGFCNIISCTCRAFAESQPPAEPLDTRLAEFDAYLSTQIRAARLVLSQKPGPRELTLQEVQGEFRRRFGLEGK